MRSIPVGDTILRAWGFAGRRILPLLGVSWLAAVFYGLLVAYFLTRLSGAMLVWPRPDAGSFNNFALFYLFCLVVVTAFANAAMATPMTREALEPGGEWKSAYFVIARREWGLFANLLLLYVIVIGIVSAIVFAGNVGIAVSLPMIGEGGVWRGVSLAPLMNGALIFFAAATGLFLATRFGFFLAPVAVADPPARLLHAWSLSSGNFWRALSIGLALFIPVIALVLLVDWVSFGTQFGDALSALFSEQHDKTLLFQMIQDHTGAIAAIWAGGLLVLNAIFAGASSSAYALVEHGVSTAVVHEYVSSAEPGYAMAAPTALHLSPDELRRVPPEFPAPAPKSVEPAPITSLAAEKETELSTTTLDEAVQAEAAIASPDAEPPAESQEIPLVTLTDEEPLAAHRDALPAMDPLGHAAPAAPDPAGGPATPLPSFVQAQPSPKNGSSEAA